MMDTIERAHGELAEIRVSRQTPLKGQDAITAARFPLDNATATPVGVDIAWITQELLWNCHRVRGELIASKAHVEIICEWKIDQR